MRLVLCLLCLRVLAAPPAKAPEWKSFEVETLEHFQALVRLDTTNPPGNEIRAVEYLKKVLEKDGIPVTIVGAEPSRPNLIARLKGSGAKKPLLLMGHTDTVSIDPKKWISHGPFSADKDGPHIYGRGTTDDKDSVAAYLMVMLTLKRLQVPLDRDVIFVAEAAEEAGAMTVGAKWLVDNHFDQISAEYCLAEGGSMRRDSGKMVANMIQTGEKIPRGVRIVARGPAGHGSRPTPNNAVVALAKAVAAAAAWTPPMKLNDTTRAYFERLAAISPPEQAKRYNEVVHPDKAAAVQAWFKANDPGHYSMITTSITPTIIKAGYQFNVIPSEAEAMLDIRALPDENMDEFFAGLKKEINNSQIEIVNRTAETRPDSPTTKIDNEMFQALETAQASQFPGIRVIPTMSTGATDMSIMRARGMQCYGLGGPVDTEDGALGFGAHSDQERILEQGLYDFTKYVWNVVNRVAARP